MALQLFRQRWILVFFIALPIGSAATLGLAYVDVYLPRDAGEEQGDVLLAPPLSGTPFLWPAIERPPLESAATVAFADDEEVIGVIVAGKARAYRVAAFHTMTNHVVNDLIEDVPITVTYCDRTDCAQLFTAPERGRTLEIMTGGYLNQLMLKGKDGFFWQKTGKFTDPQRADIQSYPTFPFTRTTWKAWRQQYPQCEVFVGAK